jgi:hypothetical protein
VGRLWEDISILGIGASDVSDQFATKLGASRDDAYFSLEHLHELGALRDGPDANPFPPLSARGATVDARFELRPAFIVSAPLSVLDDP